MENFQNFITALSSYGNVAIFVKGLPGSGKSTISNIIAGDAAYNHPTIAICETDMYFTDSEEGYQFDPSKLAEYHQKNYDTFRQNIDKRTNVVIVSNTNTQYWEFQNYLKYAAENHYVTAIIDLYDAGLSDTELHERCGHGVPLDRYEGMRKYYERTYDFANPQPPWDRVNLSCPVTSLP